MTYLQTQPHMRHRDEGHRLQSLRALILVKATTGQTGGAFSLFEVSCPPSYATSLDIHYAEDVAVYVLEGALAFFWGKEKIKAAAGSYFYRPRGTPHGFRVEGTSSARTLYIAFPAGLDQFVLEQGLLAPNSNSVTAAGRHKIETLGPLSNERSYKIMNTSTSRNKSLLHFSLLEFVLSIPFWGWVALAHAGVVPDLQMLNAAWSLTPMMAASILVYRENGTAGLKDLFKRCFDYKRIKSKAWYLPILLLEPLIVFVQYGVALLLGLQPAAPHFTLLIPIAYMGFFFGVFGEELGWTGYAIDPMQERWTALKASILLGIMWASFHAPVWIFTGASLYWIAWQWIYVVATRVLFVWIYNNTGKSLFAIALVHPGMGIYWYLWPVSANLGIPSFYDPRNLAFTAIVLAALVTFLWGSRILAQYRYRRASDGRAHMQNRHRKAAA